MLFFASPCLTKKFEERARRRHDLSAPGSFAGTAPESATRAPAPPHPGPRPSSSALTCSRPGNAVRPDFSSGAAKAIEDHVHSDPRILGRDLVFKGTRITASAIWSSLNTPDDGETILSNFPPLSRGDREACRELLSSGPFSSHPELRYSRVCFRGTAITLRGVLRALREGADDAKILRRHRRLDAEALAACRVLQKAGFRVLIAEVAAGPAVLACGDELGPEREKPRRAFALRGSSSLLRTRVTGLEPATTGSTVRDSNQLSYTPGGFARPRAARTIQPSLCGSKPLLPRFFFSGFFASLASRLWPSGGRRWTMRSRGETDLGGCSVRSR